MADPGERRPRTTRGSSGRGERQLKVRVKTAKGRTTAQARWLERQLNDPYVTAAKQQGYRSRSAFKLSEIDNKAGFLQPGHKVIDLGAAPGGWSQVAAERVEAIDGTGQVVAIDLHTIEPITGVEFFKGDFLEPDICQLLLDALGNSKVDVVLSDMAAHATGHRQTDHLKIINLVDAALQFARQVLKPGGVFLAKVLRGGTEHELLNAMKHDFAKVKHIKPEASRDSSSELFVLAQGFRPQIDRS